MGRARREHRGRGDEGDNTTTRDRQETGPPGETDRGGRDRPADGKVRQREEGTPGRENPGTDRELIAQVEDGKGGSTRQGKVDT